VYLYGAKNQGHDAHYISLRLWELLTPSSLNSADDEETKTPMTLLQFPHHPVFVELAPEKVQCTERGKDEVGVAACVETTANSRPSVP